MTKIVTRSNFGFSPRLKNYYRKFTHFKDGIPCYKVIPTKETKIEHIAMVENPAHGLKANWVENINDGKDVTIFQDHILSEDITDIFIEPEKRYNTLIQQWIYRIKNRKPKFIETGDYESVLSINGCTIHVHNKEHPENGEPHLHLKHRGENINIRINFKGKYLSTVKGYNGEDKNTKKTIKKHFIPFLNKENIKDSGMIGNDYIINLWNKNNPDQIIPITWVGRTIIG